MGEHCFLRRQLRIQVIRDIQMVHIAASELNISRHMVQVEMGQHKLYRLVAQGFTESLQASVAVHGINQQCAVPAFNKIAVYMLPIGKCIFDHPGPLCDLRRFKIIHL